ncbi:aminoacyl-tRNA deacylase [Actinomadura violacea]|uniref:YbaK/EbsC family protein n=1 Tax=Actinomadura violacea TaxID=2819934 RepID=A0ABS3RX28_9ACTN|nr:YbaK/EbsC family protein [Actinomadura violacea]MBO2461307.1 YbaK/EbsC family protein [Actinomadura violacea]
MKDALTLHRALLEWEAVHEIVRLPIGIAHADELPKALGLPADRCLVTRVFTCDDDSGGGHGGGHGGGLGGGLGRGGPRRDRGRGRRFLAGVIVRAGDRPPGEAVRRAMGAARVVPARADLVNAVTEYAAGLVCPLLLPESMPLLIDQRLADGPPGPDVVYTPTGEPSTALGIRGHDLAALCQAKPVDLAAVPDLPAPGPRRGAANTPDRRRPVG